MRVAIVIFPALALVPAIAAAEEKKADKNDPNRLICEKQEVLGSYSARGLPLVVLHDSSGKEVSRITKFVPAEEMLALMEKAR